MPEDSWEKVCREADLHEGVPRVVKTGDAEALIVRLNGKLHAVGNECSHYGCPLSEGTLIGDEIICKCHDARFDLSTGRMVSAPALNDLSVYPVRVEAGDVELGPVQKPRFPKPQGTDPRSFIIVGGGAAGNAASETLRREGFAGRITVLSAEIDQPYDRPNLSKEFMSGEAKPEWLPLRSPKFYANQGIEILTNAKVTALDPRGKTLSLQDGRTLPFDKALLATGGAPPVPAIPGADTEGCYTLRSLADARLIVDAAGRATSAVLVGAGFIGMELASALRTRGIAVDLVAREALPLARLVGERIALYLKQRHEGNGVTFHTGTNVAGISGAMGEKTVLLSDGARLRAGFVVFGLGVRPVVDYLAGSDLVQNGGVPVDARLETRFPGIFAAGDIAIVPDPSSGQGMRIEHWAVAERQGQHAARSMLGSSAAYEDPPFFWTRQTGISLKYVGFARAWDEIAYRGNVEEGEFLCGYYIKDRLLAAAGIGMQDDFAAAGLALCNHVALPAAILADRGVDLLSLAHG